MIYIFETAKSRRLAILIAVILAAMSTTAFAAGGTWSLDPTTSSARFFQGSTANPDSVNTGVARVTGKVNLNTGDLDNSIVDLNILPADEVWEHALSPEGNLPTGYVPDATDHTLLTFKSDCIIAGNGKLEVVGNLTLTRVERSVTSTPSEAYAGFYGSPVIHTTTREISFLFPNLSAALSSRPLTPVALQKEGALEVSGSARIGNEDFLFQTGSERSAETLPADSASR